MADTLPNVIELNVGGQLFTTRLATLTSDPDSTLAAMFSGRHLLDKDSQGRFFIDREGALFRHLLKFLRDGSLPALEVRPAVLKEAEYFQLKGLEEALQISTVKIAEDKVRPGILARFPKYDEVKRRLVSRAVEKAGESGPVVDVTFLVSEGADILYGDNTCRGHTSKRVYQTKTIESWFQYPDVVNMGLSEFSFDQSGLQGIITGLGLENFIASVSALMVADMVDEGFRVTIFQDGANLKHRHCRGPRGYEVCLTEVNFKFTFLPLSLPSIFRDKF